MGAGSSALRGWRSWAARSFDLRNARLDARGTTIRAVAIMGGIVIVVGPDVEVQCEGTA